MQRLRRHLASFTVTPIGAIVLAVLGIAFGLFAFGPSQVQAPAMIVGVILLVGVVGGVPLGFNRFSWRGANLDRPRVGYSPIETREINAAAADRQAEEELWHKERERRAQDGRSG